ncbi:uncharacterized protein LOC120343102 [Styela clava]
MSNLISLLCILLFSIKIGTSQPTHESNHQHNDTTHESNQVDTENFVLTATTAKPEEETTLSILEQFRRALPTVPTAKPAKIPRIPAHKGIIKKCKLLPTYRLRESCKSIAENGLIYSMEKNVLAFVNRTEEKEFYKKESVTGERSLSFGIALPGEQNCDATCPSGKEWSTATEKHERSFSPWGYCDNYDPDRLPQWISYAKCKCKGCMDPNTLEENLSYSSIELKTAIPVLRKEQEVMDFQDCTNKKCKESVVEIVIGCYCFLPFIS